MYYNILCTLLFTFLGQLISAQVAPIPNSHAHNDYLHVQPLFGALENGFTSIEVDVFLHHNQLIVSHIPVGLNHKPTLQQLYLDPLRSIVEQYKGSVYGDTTPLILMIDFKTSAPETYAKLKEVLKDYEQMLTVYRGCSVVHQRAVNILISGRSPVAQLLAEDTTLATNDASIGQLSDSAVAKVSTRYSSAWGSYFRWRGVGQMPAQQQQLLRSLVNRAHQQGKQIRFYHIPDKPRVWQLLLQHGVDWINTDRLKQYREESLRNKRKQPLMEQKIKQDD